ncbi:MAG: hypothetical protein KGL53_02585 [Elusimicrobia bacterium]|nr:hypothetical protein [Elusimicrobiota bacterium]
MKPGEREPWLAWARSKGGGGGNTPVVWLKPGESVSSPAQAYQSGTDKYCRRLPTPSPISPYSEVAQARDLPPGSYKLYAIYDLLPSAAIPRLPANVRFQTAPIDIEVDP